LGQLDFRKPEIFDTPDETLELLKVDRLAEVTVGLELITFHDIHFGFGSGQDDSGDAFQVVVSLDVRENLPAILLREVQVQEDEVRPWRIDVRALTLQIGQGFDTIDRYMQVDQYVGFTESFLSQADVSGAVLDQKNFPGNTFPILRFHAFPSIPVKAK
jgi:hypothetical protein